MMASELAAGALAETSRSQNPPGGKYGPPAPIAARRARRVHRHRGRRGVRGAVSLLRRRSRHLLRALRRRRAPGRVRAAPAAAAPASTRPGAARCCARCSTSRRSPTGSREAQRRRGRVPAEPRPTPVSPSCRRPPPAARRRAPRSTTRRASPTPRPAGGDEQRRMFARTATAGAACGPIRDGIGATFYGTCDPTAGVLLLPGAGRDGLPVPLRLRRRAAPRDLPGGGGGRSGLLGRVAAAALRHRQRLRRRDRSLPAAGHRAAGQRPGLRRRRLQPAGRVRRRWCDVLGSKRCEPRRADGASLQRRRRVRVGATARAPARPTRCARRPALPPTPACPTPRWRSTLAPPTPRCRPTPRPPTDAAIATDAAAGDGERCATALDLLSSSSPSPLATYTHRVATSFGASDDYNPLTSAGLPPGLLGRLRRARQASGCSRSRSPPATGCGCAPSSPTDARPASTCSTPAPRRQLARLRQHHRVRLATSTTSASAGSPAATPRR
jgi:hypothetical protein